MAAIDMAIAVLLFCVAKFATIFLSHKNLLFKLELEVHLMIHFFSVKPGNTLTG